MSITKLPLTVAYRDIHWADCSQHIVWLKSHIYLNDMA